MIAHWKAAQTFKYNSCLFYAPESTTLGRITQKQNSLPIPVSHCFVYSLSNWFETSVKRHHNHNQGQPCPVRHSIARKARFSTRGSHRLTTGVNVTAGPDDLKIGLLSEKGTLGNQCHSDNQVLIHSCWILNGAKGSEPFIGSYRAQTSIASITVMEQSIDATWVKVSLLLEVKCRTAKFVTELAQTPSTVGFKSVGRGTRSKEPTPFHFIRILSYWRMQQRRFVWRERESCRFI